jgi:predicted AAA+ superfamily ATPase
MSDLQTYRPRHVDGLITQLLGELPALLLTGPRATGKTTTAIRYAKSVVRLDREAEAAAFRADPDSALRSLEEPVLLDEWQVVPGVLGALKRAVDLEPRPGRFIVTGSVRADLEGDTWPGTGRLVRVPMFGMSVREIDGAALGTGFLDRLATREPTLDVQSDPPDLLTYIELALRGGFPEPALRLSGVATERWHESYVEQLLTRDVEQLAGHRDPARVARYFETLALNSAGVVDEKTLYERAGINRKTALAYSQVLQNLLVLELVPAWASNRLKRLVRLPKRYVTDPALIGAALRIDAKGVLRDGNLLGRLLDTFVAAQLRAELHSSSTRPRIFHLRQEGGRHEVDLLAESTGHGIVAIEVKASAAPTQRDARHLLWLQETLGDRFVVGAVLHTGPAAYELAERIVALPICTLWSG